MSQDCQFLDWDSGFFGYRVARLQPSRLTPSTITEALTWCRGQNIDCIYLLADSDDPPTVELAESRGFKFVDIRLTFERNLATVPSISDSPVRLFRPGDEHTLCSLARQSHRDSRFWADPAFRGRCDDLFEEWIRKSCHGWAQAVLVAEYEGKPAGYCTCHLNAEGGSIGLIAVDPRAQGVGLGRCLVNQSLSWFQERGVSSVTVVTQGRNVPAQRLYQRAGFLTKSIKLWYHHWNEN